MFSDAPKVDALLTMQANPDVSSSDGSSALHFAALHGHAEIVRRLLLGRADVHSQNARGWTPLHAAAGRGHAAALDQLLEFGALPYARTLEGLTPRDLAERVAGPPLNYTQTYVHPQRRVIYLLIRAERAFTDATIRGEVDR